MKQAKKRSHAYYSPECTFSPWCILPDGLSKKAESFPLSSPEPPEKDISIIIITRLPRNVKFFGISSDPGEPSDESLEEKCGIIKEK